MQFRAVCVRAAPAFVIDPDSLFDVQVKRIPSTSAST